MLLQAVRKPSYGTAPTNLSTLISYVTSSKESGASGPYRVTTTHQLLEPDTQKQVCFCKRFQEVFHNSLGILDITWFTDEA